MAFQYPPLPVGVDGIRILIIEPASELTDPLVCNLIPVAFSTKPKYVALSYTWGNPFPTDTSSEDNELVLLSLNNQPLYIGTNLSLSLRHLRSPTHPLSLWVDAICINQEDIMERNAQVAMMSFIYTRAMKVVAWLGAIEHKHSISIAAHNWREGQVQHFAASLSSDTKIRYSAHFGRDELVNIAESLYWTRLWIVQELCLPRNLVFVYGSDIWTYDDLQQILATYSKQSDKLDAMLRLLETREARHTAMMTLENLIERFTKSRCEELRDKVYGLLGVANDIRSFPNQNSAANAVEKYIASLDMQMESLPEPPIGTGSIVVDYSRSFYDIWVDVVKFIFFRAKSYKWQLRNQIWHTTLMYNEKAVRLIKSGRHINVVRAAGIVQEALGQKVGKELASQNSIKQIQSNPVIRAIGYLSSEIWQLGPTYESLAASFHAQQNWVGSWDAQYHETRDLEVLRKMDEEYIAKIMNYDDEDLAVVRDIQNDKIVAWHVEGGHRPPTSHPSYRAGYKKIWDTANNDDQEESKGLKICLGSDHTIALIPPAAKVGDLIVQFCNCDAAIVMRPIPLEWDLSNTDSATPSFTLVGRADVAEVFDTKNNSMRGIREEQHLFENLRHHSDKSLEVSGAVYVDFDFRTLQAITAPMTTW